MTDSRNQLKDQAINTLKAKQEIKKNMADALREKEDKAKQALLEKQKRQEEALQKERSKYEIDKLQLYFGEPYQLNDKIKILQPTVGEIIQIGEQKVYSTVHVFVANPTMYRLVLWNMGVDWNKITDFQLFQMLAPTLTKDNTEFLFGDIDFSKLHRYQKTIDDQVSVVLYDPEQDLEIDEETYDKLAWYIRSMFNIFPKVEKAKGKYTKQAIIDEEQMNYDRRKNEKYQSTLLPLISSCLNHPGFKYTKKELPDVGIVEFMDSVQRLQIYESSRALLAGSYSGFVDTSKIDKSQFDFMRDISK